MNDALSSARSMLFKICAAFLLATCGVRGDIPQYYISAAGLYDDDHVRSDGFREVRPTELTQSGYLIGYADRYAAVQIGRSAWVFHGGTTRRTGLFDAAHTSAYGRQFSEPAAVSESGAVVGWSERFVGTRVGRSAWLDQGGVVRQLGLSGPEYVAPDGYTYSQPYGVNSRAQVIGATIRVDHSVSTAWLYESGQMRQIGLTDAEHTAPAGFHASSPLAINEAGTVIGLSARFSGGQGAGNTMWMYHNGVTTPIGLRGPEHTSTDDVFRMNEASHVAGRSIRSSDGVFMGYDAWLHRDGQTTSIGLTDPQHVRSDGFRESRVWAMNATGQVAGSTGRFDGMLNRGTSAWVFDGAQTRRLGLTDAAHTNVAGTQASGIADLTDSGIVLGHSRRYEGGSPILGVTAWVHADGQTTPLGLFDSDHRSSDGREMHEASHINEQGNVIGVSWRYSGSTLAGADGWYYDSSNGGLMPLEFPTTFASPATVPVLLTEDNEVFGYYYNRGSWEGSIFRWTATDGYSDLADLVVGGIEQLGYEGLRTIWDDFDFDQQSDVIVGLANMLNNRQEQQYFALRPVPAPSGVVVTGVLALVSIRRRDRRLA